MSVPVQHEVQVNLEGMHTELLNIVLRSWDDWRSSAYAGIWRCKRSRANFVWEQMIHRAYAEFGARPDMQIIEGHETFSFLVHDQVLFRFKKGDESGLTSNVPTQQAMAFHDHQQNLFGLPDIHRVEIVYKLNKLETAISDVLVVARNGNSLAWTYSLMDADAVVFPLPTKMPAQSASSAAELVRPRESNINQDREKSE